MTILGAVVSVLIALIGGIGGWVTVRRTTTASPYEAVVARAVALEKAEMILALRKAAEDDRRGIALGSGTAHGGAGGQSLIARPVGRFATAATAGYLTLQWAQQTAEASDATMLAYSWLKLTRVA